MRFRIETSRIWNTASNLAIHISPTPPDFQLFLIYNTRLCCCWSFRYCAGAGELGITWRAAGAAAAAAVQAAHQNEDDHHHQYWWSHGRQPSRARIRRQGWNILIKGLFGTVFWKNCKNFNAWKSSLGGVSESLDVLLRGLRRNILHFYIHFFTFHLAMNFWSKALFWISVWIQWIWNLEQDLI